MSSQPLIPSSPSPQVIVPQSLRIGQYFTVLLGFGLSTLAIAARLYTKLRITRKLLSEDYFSFAAYLGLSAFLGLAIVIGKDGGDIQHKAYCNPRRKLWIPSTPGRCMHEDARGVLSGSINIASDFVILILPLPVLQRLQMPLAKKLRLSLVFSFGAFACVTSIVRIVYSIQLDPDQGSTAYQLNVNRQGLWAFAEISVGIIVGCMPLVHKSFKHLSTKFPSTSSLRIRSGSSGGSSWRRLLGRSSASGQSSRKSSSKDSGSVAPRIGTLNMTRASFSAHRESFPDTTFLTEKTLPTVPPPIHARKPLATHFGTEGNPENGYLPKKLEDTESQNGRYGEATEALDLTETWQHQECTEDTRRNETKRARYDLYPR
ncbi:MAG: hypothetical protein Q9205_003405 [Flavoplaca limonia]